MFRLNKFFVILVCIFCGLINVNAQTGPVVIKSPDGQIEIEIATLHDIALSAEGGQLAYQVSFQGKQVLEWSHLGLIIESSPVLGSNVRIQSSEMSVMDETWTSVQGKANPIRNHYNAVTVQTLETDSNGRRLIIEARAYDDGVAFRYFIPEQPFVKELKILNEITQFRFSKDANTFPMISRGFQTSNEDDYHELTINGLHPEYLVNLPLLINLPGIAWVGLTEADLEDYSNLYVTAPGNGTLTARLATRVENINTDADIAPSFDPKLDSSKISVIAQTPLKSGWRILMIADKPGRLVESNMVVNLNPPNAIGDISWIKPGKSSWDWWNASQQSGVKNPGDNNGKNNKTIKYCIDFCAQNNLEYMLIDGGWSKSSPAPQGKIGYSFRGPMDLRKSVPAIDIPMLVEYAKSKNVHIWVWAHFRDVNDQMDTAFAQFEKWGIVGVKIDFLDRSDQWMVNWYRTAARKAAGYHLMLDFHGAFKPDGMSRTFPNVLTREGVMGEEYNRWSARITPRHNVTLAFTRMLAGPLDYTPGGFNNATPENFISRSANFMVKGTRVHQTALFVVYESEFQIVSDSPANYDGQKELAFIKAVPSSWDETRVLNGVPAKYITIARRKGNEWFIGCITEDSLKIDLSLNFLENGSYNAEIYSDGPNADKQPKNSVVKFRRVNKNTILKLKLAEGGGWAARIEKVK